MIGIEKIIEYNSLAAASDLREADQIIPFTIGIITFVVGISDVAKPRPKFIQRNVAQDVTSGEIEQIDTSIRLAAAEERLKTAKSRPKFIQRNTVQDVNSGENEQMNMSIRLAAPEERLKIAIKRASTL